MPKVAMRVPAGHSQKARQLLALKKEEIYRLHVSLAGSIPFIWRRILVPGRFALSSLHTVLQQVMGWNEEHLHEFIIGDNHYGDSKWDDGGFGPKMLDENKFQLKELVPSARKSFRYIYDFGDGWIHNVKVESILPPEPDGRYPICLAGENACPPEDSGGIGGYFEKLRIMRNKSHPEYKEIKEWMGRFDPSHFNLEVVNRFIREFSKE